MNNNDNIEKSDHPEVFDDFKVDKENGIFDESDNEIDSEEFTITTYGADFPVESLVSRMKKEVFYIPKFQRNFVWSQKHASRFIESLLMGLPIPSIFLYKEEESGKHVVVDGQQRLTTLFRFYQGKFGNKDFYLMDVREKWNNKTYDQLSVEEQLRLDDFLIHATIFKQNDNNLPKSLFFVFERINSGGIRLTPQEIRNCVYDTEITNFSRTLNDNEIWRNVFGQKKHLRFKDQELVIRALAMILNRKHYKRTMKEFLNNFCYNKKDDGANLFCTSDIESAGKLFIDSVKIVYDICGKKTFRLKNSINAALFEAVIVGVSERKINKRDEISRDKFIEKYNSLLASKEFIDSISSNTSLEKSVSTRHSLAISFFKDI